MHAPVARVAWHVGHDGQHNDEKALQEGSGTRPTGRASLSWGPKLLDNSGQLRFPNSVLLLRDARPARCSLRSRSPGLDLKRGVAATHAPAARVAWYVGHDGQHNDEKALQEGSGTRPTGRASQSSGPHYNHFAS